MEPTNGPIVGTESHSLNLQHEESNTGSSCRNSSQTSWLPERHLSELEKPGNNHWVCGGPRPRFVVLSKNHALAKVVEEIKRGSSKWVKTQGKEFLDFAWQGGYGAFSVSSSMEKVVSRYVANQEEHHRQVSFQEEFRKFCRRHGVELDERYAWD